LLTHRAEEVRKQIQATKLVKSLHEIAEGKAGGPPAAQAVRVSAALGLLRKTLPDLSSVELKSDPDNPLVTRVEYVVVDPKNPAA
jgi:hypothetical protein